MDIYPPGQIRTERSSVQSRVDLSTIVQGLGGTLRVERNQKDSQSSMLPIHHNPHKKSAGVEPTSSPLQGAAFAALPRFL